MSAGDGGAETRKASFELRVPAWSLLAVVAGCLLTASIGLAANDAPAQDGDAASGEGAHIVIGPDILASRDGEFPHVEVMSASNPTNAWNLIAGAITLGGRSDDAACTAYASLDGGQTWRAVQFPEQVEGAGADPQVAFTPRGTAIFVCMADVTTVTGTPRSALHVYRSEDGGLTWEGPVELADHSYDHPQIGVDRTTGRYAGHIYIGALYERDYRLGLFRSEDDGRSFIGPVLFARGGGRPEGHGLNVTGVAVLSDGTIAANYMDFPLEQRERDVRPLRTAAWMVASEDGGLSFSAPRRVATRIYDPPDSGMVSRLAGFASWVADGSDGATRDRLYQSWEDWRTGSARVVVTWSSDRGHTWSEPAAVTPNQRSDVHQFLPALAANRDGTLGVAYSETGAGGRIGEHRRVFTASMDGGLSFLHSRSLSTAPSRPEASEINARPLFRRLDTTEDKLMFTLVSALQRWPGGGDYMGLIALPDGSFHSMWAGARPGAFQLWGTTIRVRSATHGEPDPRSPGSKRVRGVISGRVELVADPGRWDPERRELHLPLRLRNISDEPIYPPLEVKISRLGWTGELPEDLERYWLDRRPSVVNADNGESGPGGTFDYTTTLRDLSALEPGHMTGARVWRIHKPHDETPPIQVEVTGAVPDR